MAFEYFGGTWRILLEQGPSVLTQWLLRLDCVEGE